MADEELHDLTLVELRARLRERSMPTAGKKNELIKRLSVLSQTLPAVQDDPMEEEEEEEVVPVKKGRKSTKKTSKKSKTTITELVELDEEMEQEIKMKDEEAVEEKASTKKGKKTTAKRSKKSKASLSQESMEPEEAEEKEEEEAKKEVVVKKARKSTKKPSSSKKSKKRSQEPLEEVEEAVIEEEKNEEEKKEEEKEEEHNASSATYDIVSDEEAAKKKEEEEKKKKGPSSSARRPSECRRSIFKRLGLDPVAVTPTGGKKREAEESTPTRRSTVKKRRTEVLEMDTVDDEKEETTVPPADEESTVPPAEEEKEPIEEEEETTVPPEECDHGMQPIDNDDEEGTVPTRLPEMNDSDYEDEEKEEYDDNNEEREEEEEKEQEHVHEEEEEEEEEYENQGDQPAFNHSDVFSEDGAEPPIDESILSEVSVKSAARSSRRSSIGVPTPRPSSAKKAPDSVTMVAPISASRAAGAGKPPLAPRSAKLAPATAEKAQPQSSSRAGGRMAPGERFKAQHQKLFAKQEFIGDTMAKKEERKAALLKSSASAQRLATPKAAGDMRQPLRQRDPAFKFGSSAVPKSFQFGPTAVEDIQKVQKKPSLIPGPSKPVIVKPLNRKMGEEKKLDAKERAKMMARGQSVKNTPIKLLTVPDDCSFVDRMATPKAMLSSASRTHRGANRYTPRTGKVSGFVDTSKLSDREYQLAVEAGLIGGKKTQQKSEQKAADERRNRARDEILNVKRKLNLQ